jgi:hypothetical protein
MNTNDIYQQLLNSERPELADVMLRLEAKCRALRSVSDELLGGSTDDLVVAADLL